MPARRLLATAVVALALAACGAADDPDADPGTPASTAPASSAAATTAEAPDLGIAHPTGATDVVMRVVVGGGFVPLEFSLSALPTWTLYGDGTVIYPGPIPESFPPPALAPLVRAHLDEGEVQALLRSVEAAGLLAEPAADYGNMGQMAIADAPTTSFRVTADGSTYVHDAYALGFDVPADAGMPEDTARARAALAGVVDALPRPDGEPYAAASVAVWIGPWQGDAATAGAPLTWPAATPLATAGGQDSSTGYRCALVEGADAAAVLALAGAEASSESRWVDAGAEGAPYRLIFRQLLPDEAGCQPSA